MNLEDVKRLVLGVLPRIKSERIIADEIARRADMPIEVRTQWPTRQIIRLLRLDGYPICSSNRGYWISSDRSEVLKTARDIAHRIEAMSLVVKALENTASNMPGQMDLF